MDQADAGKKEEVAPRRSIWLAVGLLTAGINLFLLGGAGALALLGKRSDPPPVAPPSQSEMLKLIGKQGQVIDQQQWMIDQGLDQEKRAYAAVLAAQTRIELLEKLVRRLSQRTDLLQEQVDSAARKKSSAAGKKKPGK